MRPFVIPVLLELATGCSAARGPGTLLGGLAFTIVAAYGYAKLDNRARRRYAATANPRVNG